MRHRRGIDLIPEKGAIDPDRGVGHLRLADLADDQLLGVRCSKCDHNQWVDRWAIAGKYGHDVTLDELRPLLKCTKCGNTEATDFGSAGRTATDKGDACVIGTESKCNLTNCGTRPGRTAT
jgi:ribosomal protein S27E